MANGKYYGSWDGITRDELEAAGDGIPKFIRNIDVGSDTVVQRGMLMAATTPTGTYSLATAADTNKFLVIARDDFEADSDHTICQAFTMGRFHSNKIITASSDTAPVSLFEAELRKQGIHLVELHDKFGHYDQFSS